MSSKAKSKLPRPVGSRTRDSILAGRSSFIVSKSKLATISSKPSNVNSKTSRVKPIPNFNQLHQQWQSQLDRGKLCCKKANTSVHEFDFNSQLSYAPTQPKDVLWEQDFEADPEALQSILKHEGLSQHSVLQGRATIAAVPRNRKGSEHTAKSGTQRIQHKTPSTPQSRRVLGQLPSDFLRTRLNNDSSGNSSRTNIQQKSGNRSNGLIGSSKKPRKSFVEEQEAYNIEFEVDNNALASIIDNTGIAGALRKQPVANNITRQTYGGRSTRKQQQPREGPRMSIYDAVSRPYQNANEFYTSYRDRMKRVFSELDENDENDAPLRPSLHGKVQQSNHGNKHTPAAMRMPAQERAHATRSSLYNAYTPKAMVTSPTSMLLQRTSRLSIYDSVRITNVFGHMEPKVSSTQKMSAQRMARRVPKDMKPSPVLQNDRVTTEQKTGKKKNQENLDHMANKDVSHSRVQKDVVAKTLTFGEDPPLPIAGESCRSYECSPDNSASLDDSLGLNTTVFNQLKELDEKEKLLELEIQRIAEAEGHNGEGHSRAKDFLLDRTTDSISEPIAHMHTTHSGTVQNRGQPNQLQQQQQRQRPESGTQSSEDDRQPNRPCGYNVGELAGCLGRGAAASGRSRNARTDPRVRAWREDTESVTEKVTDRRRLGRTASQQQPAVAGGTSSDSARSCVAEASETREAKSNDSGSATSASEAREVGESRRPLFYDDTTSQHILQCLELIQKQQMELLRLQASSVGATHGISKTVDIEGSIDLLQRELQTLMSSSSAAKKQDSSFLSGKSHSESHRGLEPSATTRTDSPRGSEPTVKTRVEHGCEPTVKDGMFKAPAAATLSRRATAATETPVAASGGLSREEDASVIAGLLAGTPAAHIDYSLTNSFAPPFVSTAVKKPPRTPAATFAPAVLLHAEGAGVAPTPARLTSSLLATPQVHRRCAEARAVSAPIRTPLAMRNAAISYTVAQHLSGVAKPAHRPLFEDTINLSSALPPTPTVGLQALEEKLFERYRSDQPKVQPEREQVSFDKTKTCTASNGSSRTLRQSPKEIPTLLAQVTLQQSSQRFHDVLLDEECALHMCYQLPAAGSTRCRDPVATMLFMGDDMHFVPIHNVMKISSHVGESAFARAV
ncbi:PREDICTED: uncharacterized protein LOC106817128 [Priapulus caudatus]|uniref:Uncharacterized protein LOC106817128 n=1 Tax=Priapulus caudatus TaxID=37621 RepID=A0ABM1EYJ0_PRICU|nr:PREDICTED: uncharacterized protein LOC106817128 [Priapulus caudatus]